MAKWPIPNYGLRQAAERNIADRVIEKLRAGGTLPSEACEAIASETGMPLSLITEAWAKEMLYGSRDAADDEAIADLEADWWHREGSRRSLMR